MMTKTYTLGEAAAYVEGVRVGRKQGAEQMKRVYTNAILVRPLPGVVPDLTKGPALDPRAR